MSHNSTKWYIKCLIWSLMGYTHLILYRSKNYTKTCGNRTNLVQLRKTQWKFRTMIEIKPISQEKIKEIVDTLTEVHTRISALEGIINKFQSSMVSAESQEDRENLLQSVNLLELETSTLKAIALAVERISKICINLHKDNIGDHQDFSSAINEVNESLKLIKPHLKSLATIADAFETGKKSAKYSKSMAAFFKNLGIVVAAIAAPEILRKMGVL